MHTIDYYFRPSNMWRVIKRFFWVLSWIGRLVSATAEIFLHRNFGGRYLVMLVAGFTFYCFCASVAPFVSPLRGISILVMFVLLMCHFSFARNRHRLSAAEPQSLWSGDSWDIWSQLGMQQRIAHGLVEPFLCLGVAVPLALLDPFIGAWLVLAGMSLFLKVHIAAFSTRRRIVAAADARVQAQQFNTALQQFIHRPQRGGQQVHRARLVRSPRQKQP